MLKLKNVSRRLSIKYAQNISATMPSAVGDEPEVVNIPKAPKIPVEFVEKSGPQSDFEVKTPRLDDEPLNEEQLGALPTINPKQLAGVPEWKHVLIDTLTAMGHANVVAPLYVHDVIQKIRAAKSEKDVADIKAQMKKDLIAAERHAIVYAAKMKRMLTHLA